MSALLAGAAAVAIPLVAGDDSKSYAAPAEATAPARPAPAAEAAPAYGAVLPRPQTAHERAVQATTPASDARLVTSDGADDVYVGRIDDQGVLCISVEHRPTERLTTTCGGASAIAEGELMLARGGDGEHLVIGVAPAGSASVTVKTRSGAVIAPVKGGLYHVRPDGPPVGLAFADDAGNETASHAPAIGQR